MNHFYQVIRGKTTFVIHEYCYGSRTGNTSNYPISDLGRHLSCIPPHFKSIPTIDTNDLTVKRNTDYYTKPEEA